ncbi:MAG: dihydrolipoyl dehydrogenase [Deltaproteobacteria bacterium]|nr:dihydrolipoyl dehydrogenase [Deltaproteobacteria bacterium]
MPESITVRVPDIGEFDGVDVVDLLVGPGDTLAVEDSIVTLESDKASMDVPSPVAGVVERMVVSVGDQVGEGDALCVVQVEASTAVEAPPAKEPELAPVPEAATASASAPDTEVLVLGGGPGGYTAAFRAADLGKKVTLVERYPTLGGVCLNVGCIPSKTLLHMADVIEEAAALAEHGIDFGAPRLDLERIRARKNEVVQGLTRGLSGLAKQRHVEVIQGEGRFVGSHELEVTGKDGTRRIRFQNAILAAGSRTVVLPGIPDDPRILDSTSALELGSVAGRLLVIGGGIIGLEMATVYAAFGAQVSVVELFDRLMTGTDRDLVRPLERRLKQRLDAIWLGTRVEGIEAKADGLLVTFSGKDAPAQESFDQVLVAVGRRPNGDRIGAEAAGLLVDERGFVPVDTKQRTNLAHVYAIGDLTGQPMLAHKATHEGKTAAEVIAGLPASFDARAIPSVAYTDPEIAWTGLTEETAKAEGIAVRKAVFPWAASGRALSIGRNEGLTKLLFSEEDGRLLGAGITGPGAGDLIAEATLALEMGADAEDIGLTVHPHPTLSETIAMAAELAAGTITDLLPPKRS